MYNDVVHRTQIYLDDVEQKLLDDAARSSGASRSELIRRAIRATLGSAKLDDRLLALRQSAGVWRRRRFDGQSYVEAQRRGSAARRRRLGLD
jgi:Arc/MetJ-type ribon-helix-helix transcriptional regulator